MTQIVMCMPPSLSGATLQPEWLGHPWAHCNIPSLYQSTAGGPVLVQSPGLSVLGLMRGAVQSCSCWQLRLEAMCVQASELTVLGPVRREDLDRVCVIGRGSSGLVWKVRHKPTGMLLVLKVGSYIHCLWSSQAPTIGVPAVLAMLHERCSPGVFVALQQLTSGPPVFDSLGPPVSAPQVVNVNQQSEQMKRQIDTELRTLSGTKSPHVVPYLHAYVQVC